jgi:hypothetical protein
MTAAAREWRNACFVVTSDGECPIPLIRCSKLRAGGNRGAFLMPARRFPPPWSIEDIGAAFIVKDGAGQARVCLL